MSAPADAATGAFVRFRHVSQRFGATEVLRGLNLAIEPGSFLAVVGRSGSGKSTLLRILASLDGPSAGSLALEPAGAPVRMMFQEPRLLPWASVHANVEVGLGAERRRPDAAARAAEALAAVGLTVKATAWPSELSGGQRQRVALARALVSRPAVLALDEPLGALDALTRIEMQRLVETVWQAQRFTAMLVTHDVGEAVALADRVVMIEQGRIALDVEIDLDRPRHRGSPGFAAHEAEILDRILGAAA